MSVRHDGVRGVRVERRYRDSTELALRGRGGHYQARMLARLYAERCGAGEEVTDRLVQLMDEVVGPGLRDCLVRVEDGGTWLRVSATYHSSGAYDSLQWWRAQHPLGEEGWRRFVASLADAFGEQPTKNGYRIWARIDMAAPRGHRSGPPGALG